MVGCSVVSCKNYRNEQNKGGITFHIFPRNKLRRDMWIAAIGRPNWTPAKFSTICSDHFSLNSFYITNKGYRRITKTAVPTIGLLSSLYSELDSNNQIEPSDTGGDVGIYRGEDVGMYRGEDVGIYRGEDVGIYGSENVGVDRSGDIDKSRGVDKGEKKNVMKTSTALSKATSEQRLRGQMIYYRLQAEQRLKKIKVLLQSNRRQAKQIAKLKRELSAFR